MSLNVRQLARLRKFRANKERLDQRMFSSRKLALDRLDQRMQALAVNGSLAAGDAAALLANGDSAQWRMTEQVRAADGMLMTLLEERRSESVAAVASALNVLVRSRQQTRRAELLEEAARELFQQRQERATQAASDDRFASRSHWQKTRVRNRDNAQVS